MPTATGDEARYFHWRLFGVEPDDVLVARYEAANRQLLTPSASEQQMIDEVVRRGLDVEAVEMTLRRRNRYNALSKKLQVLLYLVEVRSASYELFVNPQSRRPSAVAALATCSLSALWKWVKGIYLLRRYRLLA